MEKHLVMNGKLNRQIVMKVRVALILYPDMAAKWKYVCEGVLLYSEELKRK